MAKPTRVWRTVGLLGAALFLGLLFAVQFGIDRLVLTASAWLFGSH
jgi:hypothetical protein